MNAIEWRLAKIPREAASVPQQRPARIRAARNQMPGSRISGSSTAPSTSCQRIWNASEAEESELSVRSPAESLL